MIDDYVHTDDDDPDAPPDNIADLFRRGDHVEVGGRLVARMQARSPVTFCDGHFYQYEQSGVFEQVDQAHLSRIVQGFAGQPVATGKKPKPLVLKASDVVGAIRLASDQVAERDFFASAAQGVAFENGFLDVSSERLQLQQHSPTHRARFAYPFPFASEASPVKLLEFFDQVFPDDQDKREKVALLQQYLGISLLGLATKYQRVLVLVGDGANGKGVFSSVAERCVPPGSVCAIPPQDVGQEYRRALLAGKLLNIVSELPEADILDSESWKSIVAGDTTTGREIRKEPFSFKPVAGHIYSANRLPGTTDQSHGFWRRLLVVKFNRVFLEHEQDPELADRIVEEAPAIVSWALAGAQHVLTQGRFTSPSSSEAALEEWKRAADQVRAFVEDWTTPLDADASPSAGTQATDLYKAYRRWANDNGHSPMASNKFGERMRVIGLPAHRMMVGRYYPVRLERVWGA